MFIDALAHWYPPTPLFYEEMKKKNITAFNNVQSTARTIIHTPLTEREFVLF